MAAGSIEVAHDLPAFINQRGIGDENSLVHDGVARPVDIIDGLDDLQGIGSLRPQGLAASRHSRGKHVPHIVQFRDGIADAITGIFLDRVRTHNARLFLFCQILLVE